MLLKERSLIARNFYARLRRTTTFSMRTGKGLLVGVLVWSEKAKQKFGRNVIEHLGNCWWWWLWWWWSLIAFLATARWHLLSVANKTITKSYMLVPSESPTFFGSCCIRSRERERVLVNASSARVWAYGGWCCRSTSLRPACRSIYKVDLHTGLIRPFCLWVVLDRVC